MSSSHANLGPHETTASFWKSISRFKAVANCPLFFSAGKSTTTESDGTNYLVQVLVPEGTRTVLQTCTRYLDCAPTCTCTVPFERYVLVPCLRSMSSPKIEFGNSFILLVTKQMRSNNCGPSSLSTGSIPIKLLGTSTSFQVFLIRYCIR